MFFVMSIAVIVMSIAGIVVSIIGIVMSITGIVVSITGIVVSITCIVVSITGIVMSSVLSSCLLLKFHSRYIINLGDSQTSPVETVFTLDWVGHHYSFSWQVNQSGYHWIGFQIS